MNPHTGHNGYSLRMQGRKPGFNDHALGRAIVMHGAPYVSAELAKEQGRIGRSWGSPVARTAVTHRLIDSMKEGQLVFSYYPDARWLSSSAYLNCGSSASKQTVAQRPLPGGADSWFGGTSIIVPWFSMLRFGSPGRRRWLT